MSTRAISQTDAFPYSGGHATRSWRTQRSHWVACPPEMEAVFDTATVGVDMSFIDNRNPALKYGANMRDCPPSWTHRF